MAQSVLHSQLVPITHILLSFLFVQGQPQTECSYTKQPCMYSVIINIKKGGLVLDYR